MQTTDTPIKFIDGFPVYKRFRKSGKPFFSIQTQCTTCQVQLMMELRDYCDKDSSKQCRKCAAISRWNRPGFRESVSQKISQSRAGIATIHGHSSRKWTSKTYSSWVHMKDRCLNPNNNKYSYYGGRGITIDPAWNEFKNFLSDMGECPPDCTIDRIDPNGNYTKENCKWSSRHEQSVNRRNNVLDRDGKRVAVEAVKLGIVKAGIASKRVKSGWPIDEAISTPTKPHFRMITHNGKTQSMSDWARETGIKIETIYHRLKAGWGTEDVLAKTIVNRINRNQP